jgi:hypothetical protein
MNLNKFRLWGSRNIGFWWPPIGEWWATPSYKMRRLRPNGTWEYREMTPAEADEEMSSSAW